MNSKKHLYQIEEKLCDKIVLNLKNDKRFDNQKEMQCYNRGIAEAMTIIREELNNCTYK